ncbi:MAG: hypothetical protein U0M00_01640 [Clostridia bacterium]|nr:hypothetical protein [Clostridia bacterium]
MRTIDELIDRISDKNYIDQLKETMYQAMNEKEDIEPRLQEQYANEEEELRIEYMRSVL